MERHYWGNPTSLWTTSYKGGWIHGKWEGGEEKITAVYGVKRREGFKSLATAKGWITKQERAGIVEP